jgi:DNA gyrase/topoisomerase IV subunit A
LATGDEVVSIEPIRHARAVCATQVGRLLAFPVEDVSELSGVGRGVILMRLDKDDRFIGAVTTPPGAGVTVSGPDGRHRQLRLKDIPLGQRAGKGQRVVKRMTLTAVRGVGEEEGHGSPK